MNRVKLVFSMLLILLGLSMSANAQEHVFAPYVDAGVGITSTLTGTNSITARNPDYNVGLGFESNTKHLLIDFNGQFSSQNVRSFASLTNLKGTSFAGTVNASGYVKVGKLLLGGGARYSDTVTSNTLSALVPSSINELVPYVGGGFQFGRDRVIVNYVLPGRTSAYKERELDIHNEIYLTKSGRLRLTQDIYGRSADIAGLGGTRVTGAEGRAGVKFVF